MGYDGHHNVYLRKKVSECTNNLLGQPKFEFLKPDMSMTTSLQDYQGGIIKMRCAIGLAENMQDLSIGGWNVNLTD